MRKRIKSLRIRKMQLLGFGSRFKLNSRLWSASTCCCVTLLANTTTKPQGREKKSEKERERALEMGKHVRGAIPFEMNPFNSNKPSTH